MVPEYVEVEPPGEESLPLLDIHMNADVPVFTAIVDPYPPPDDYDGGMTAVNLDHFRVPIPDDYRRRFLDWYQKLPVWQNEQPDMTHLHRVGRELADDLAQTTDQPVAYETPYERPGHVGRCQCPTHRVDV